MSSTRGRESQRGCYLSLKFSIGGSKFLFLGITKPSMEIKELHSIQVARG